MYINKLKILILGFILSILFFFSHPQSVFADPIGAWSSTTNLPTNIASHVSAFESGKVFVFGGANVDDYSDISSSIPNSGGTLPGWVLVSNLPETRYWGSLVKKEKRLYILGGAMFTGITNYKNTVYSATIQIDGSVSFWQSLSALPDNRAMGVAVIVGNRIYYAGGFDGSGTHDEIYYADINPNGTLGSWTTSSISLPEPLSGFGMVEHQNNIIVFGGYNGSVSTNKVYKASVNLDGSLSAFTPTQPLPQPVNRGAFIKTGSTIISAGGHNGSNFLNKVYYTNIDFDGTAEPWQESAHNLPTTMLGSAITYANDYIYLTGGFNGAYLNSVYYAPINVSGEVDLPVPLLKQTDPLWGGDIYDSADNWAPENPTIADWGCAMTSAAMVFQFHKITKLPDGTNLDPGTLNTYLINEPDGYIRNGLVNWLALSRLSKKAKGQNPDFTYDALQYRRINGEDKPQLTTDLQNGIPGILEEPGHFVVAKGIGNETFNINDPFHAITDLNPYSNTFLSLGRYIPTANSLSESNTQSNPNLSYIMLVVDEDVEISFKDENNQEVGDAFIQQPIDNEFDISKKSGQPIKIVHHPTPGNGNYSVYISSQDVNAYQLDTYFYNEQGEVIVKSAMSTAGPEGAEAFEINYSQTDASTINRVITFESAIADVNELRSLNLITTDSLARRLIRLLEQAQEDKTNGRLDSALRRLEHFEDVLNRELGDRITEEAYQILFYDVSTLKNNF